MPTEQESTRDLLRGIHRDAVRMANDLDGIMRMSRIEGHRATLILNEDLERLSVQLYTLMGTNNMLLNSQEHWHSKAEEFRGIAFDGAAMIGFLRCCKLSQLLGWWGKEQIKRLKEAKA